MKSAIALAAKATGGQAALASALGVLQQRVWLWINRKGSRVPYEFGARIEATTNGVVTRQMLYPDDWEVVWPELAERERRRKAARARARARAT